MNQTSTNSPEVKRKGGVECQQGEDARELCHCSHGEHAGTVLVRPEYRVTLLRRVVVIVAIFFWQVFHL